MTNKQATNIQHDGIDSAVAMIALKELIGHVVLDNSIEVDSIHAVANRNTAAITKVRPLPFAMRKRDYIYPAAAKTPKSMKKQLVAYAADRPSTNSNDLIVCEMLKDEADKAEAYLKEQGIEFHRVDCPIQKYYRAFVSMEPMTLSGLIVDISGPEIKERVCALLHEKREEVAHAEGQRLTAMVEANNGPRSPEERVGTYREAIDSLIASAEKNGQGTAIREYLKTEVMDSYLRSRQQATPQV